MDSPTYTYTHTYTYSTGRMLRDDIVFGLSCRSDMKIIFENRFSKYATANAHVYRARTWNSHISRNIPLAENGWPTVTTNESNGASVGTDVHFMGRHVVSVRRCRV